MAMLSLFIGGLRINPGGIMAERVDNEYPPEATIGDQRLRKDRGKIAEAVRIPSVSTAKYKSLQDDSIIQELP